MSGLRVFLFIGSPDGTIARIPSAAKLSTRTARAWCALQGPTHWLRGARGSLDLSPRLAPHATRAAPGITATSFPLAQDGYGNRLTLILTLTLTRISAVSFAFAAARLVRT